MDNFVETLRSFDSHERGILLQWATGQPFALNPKLRSDLEKKLGLEIPVNAFVAMDYVLDWLGAALKVLEGPDGRSAIHSKAVGYVTGSPEDIDLLIAWEDDKRHLVLIEAKGFTGWTNKQMRSKANRLGALFGAVDNDQVDLHFVLVGPARTAGLDTSGWPTWMLREDRTIFLELPSPGERWAVQRGVRSEDGTWSTRQADWTHWRLKQRRQWKSSAD